MSALRTEGGFVDVVETLFESFQRFALHMKGYDHTPEQPFQMNGFKVLVYVRRIPEALIPRVECLVLRILLDLLRTPKLVDHHWSPTARSISRRRSSNPANRTANAGE